LVVGFGISKSEHVPRVIGAGADTAIVGSAFINIIAKGQKSMLKQLETAACNMKVATAKHPS
jgi:tryptophan synthase alpha subunit